MNDAKSVYGSRRSFAPAAALVAVVAGSLTLHVTAQVDKAVPVSVSKTQRQVSGGLVDSRMTMLRGIPFVALPVGDLR